MTLYEEMLAVMSSDIQVAIAQCESGGPSPKELTRILADSVASLVKMPTVEFTRKGNEIVVTIGKAKSWS